MFHTKRPCWTALVDSCTTSDNAAVAFALSNHTIKVYDSEKLELKQLVRTLFSIFMHLIKTLVSPWCVPLFSDKHRSFEATPIASTKSPLLPFHRTLFLVLHSTKLSACGTFVQERLRINGDALSGPYLYHRATTVAPSVPGTRTMSFCSMRGMAHE